MGCAVQTPQAKRRRKSLPTARPYGELSEEAKARARECWREKGSTWDVWDSDQLTEFFQQELDEEWGIEEAELSWSLGYCQGDGVNFTANLNLERMAAKNETIQDIIRAVELLEAAGGWESSPEWSASVDANGGHVNCYTFHRSNEDEERVLGELCSAMEAELEQVHKQACRRLEALGYAEIEYHDSNEHIDQELTANDHYLFNEEGDFLL